MLALVKKYHVHTFDILNKMQCIVQYGEISELSVYGGKPGPAVAVVFASCVFDLSELHVLQKLLNRRISIVC